MAGIRVSYWLPRLFVIGFALSLLLPAPQFVLSMGRGAFTLWLARLIWVVGLPVVFCLILLVVLWLGPKIGGRRQP